MTTKFAHIGQKIKHEMQRLEMRPKDLADHFGIKQPSINDLFDTGRLAKKHYPALTRLNGKSLEWWFDLDAEYVATDADEDDAYFMDSEEIRYSLDEPEKGNEPHKVSEPVRRLKPASEPNLKEAELLELFRALPESEQQRFTDELKGKASYFKRLFMELLAKKKA